MSREAVMGESAARSALELQGSMPSWMPFSREALRQVIDALAAHTQGLLTKRAFGAPRTVIAALARRVCAQLGKLDNDSEEGDRLYRVFRLSKSRENLTL